MQTVQIDSADQAHAQLPRQAVGQHLFFATISSRRGTLIGKTLQTGGGVLPVPVEAITAIANDQWSAQSDALLVGFPQGLDPFYIQHRARHGEFTDCQRHRHSSTKGSQASHQTAKPMSMRLGQIVVAMIVESLPACFQL
ncbi:hypothetical protein B551_0223155 [Cupriavidus sp. HPC(L)]|nr:hypothetical protein B551_0223155 [Cupriavidus sp. HPC(L)]